MVTTRTTSIVIACDMHHSTACWLLDHKLLSYNIVDCATNHQGIANRLGLSWSLSDRWAKVARSAISASTPQQLLPIWSVATPLVATTKPNSIQTDVRRVSGKKRVRFVDVTGAFVSWLVMVKVSLYPTFYCIGACLFMIQMYVYPR